MSEISPNGNIVWEKWELIKIHREYAIFQIDDGILCTIRFWNAGTDRPNVPPLPPVICSNPINFYSAQFGAAASFNGRSERLSCGIWSESSLWEQNEISRPKCNSSQRRGSFEPSTESGGRSHKYEDYISINLFFNTARLGKLISKALITYPMCGCWSHSQQFRPNFARI